MNVATIGAEHHNVDVTPYSAMLKRVVQNRDIGSAVFGCPDPAHSVGIDNDRTLLGLVGCAAVAVPRVVRIDLTQSIQGRPVRLTVETH